MKLPSSYSLDRENIKLKAYRLLCYFYANKEISRTTTPEKRTENLAKLEDTYFFTEISKLLIDIAISVRVLDNQMKSLNINNQIKTQYIKSMEHINKYYSCMMFDEMNLREVCNKIIHANIVEPHFQEANDRHEIDEYNWLGWSEGCGVEEDVPEPEPIKWKHLTYNIRLGGKHNGKQWWHLLEVPVFVEAICELLS